MRIIEEEQLDFDDVLIMPRRSSLNSRKEVNIVRQFVWRNADTKESHEMYAIPIMAANMSTTGTLKMAKLLSFENYMCALEKHYSAKDICDLYSELETLANNEGLRSVHYREKVFVSVGIRESLDTLIEVNKKFPLIGINCDVPNGYVPRFIDRIQEIRKLFPQAFIVAGTISTSDIAYDLIDAGANCVRGSIGSGSVCTTRLKTGVGRPALSTIMEVADACHQVNAYFMNDGGCKNPGDIAKAFGAGADFVMTGSMFAGTYESAGEVLVKYVNHQPKEFKQYYGMSSIIAQEQFFGGFDSSYKASEGREKLIPCVGHLKDVIEDINGGLRSACAYVGATKLKRLSKHCTFYKVRRQVNTLYENCEDIV